MKTGIKRTVPSGRHVITLELNDFAYAALALYAAADHEGRTLEEAAFAAVLSSVGTIIQFTEEDFGNAFSRKQE